MTENNKIIARSLNNDFISTIELIGGLDKHFKCGHFIVELNHEEAKKVGIPFDDCGVNHYLSAHLFVTESGTKEKLPGKRIGQTLILTSCNDSHSGIYTRTGKYQPNGEVEWGDWSKVTDNSEVHEWNSDSSINTFVNAGTYAIIGERLNVADGLPIANSNPGHTISARLVVLDSSIIGTGKDSDKCVTQILYLGNRTGGDGDVYIRTGRGSSKNQLTGGYGWEPWGKLQQNIEVGQVTSLDCYIDNGMYSGVYTDGTTFFETFVMVVINNYAVAGETGKVRSVSQFKYALGTDGTFSYKTRTGQGNTGIAWGDWVDIGAATTADIQDNSITAQKLSTDVRSKVENPLRPLFIAAGAEYNDSGADKTKTAPFGETVNHKAGHYYLNGLGDITEEQMIAIYNADRISNLAPIAFYRLLKIRTNLPTTITGDEGGGLMNLYYLCAECASMETIRLTNTNSLTVDNLSFTFYNCSNLICIYDILDISSIASASKLNYPFWCSKLVEVRIKGLKINLSMSKCTDISKNSILYAISNAKPGSAITITLHPDAYVRLAGDADIVAALEAQPLVSLVSA